MNGKSDYTTPAGIRRPLKSAIIIDGLLPPPDKLVRKQKIEKPLALKNVEGNMTKRNNPNFNTPVLLIIDMLEDFFREGRLKAHRRALVTRTNELARLAREHNVPIVWVRQAFKPDLSDAFLAMRKKQFFHNNRKHRRQPGAC